MLFAIGILIAITFRVISWVRIGVKRDEYNLRRENVSWVIEGWKKE